MTTFDLGTIRHRCAIAVPSLAGLLAMLLAGFAFAASHYADGMLFLAAAAAMGFIAINKQHAPH